MIGLTAAQRERGSAWRGWVDEVVAPRAAQFDREEWIPPEIIAGAASQGCFGALVSIDCGGVALDPGAFGAMNEELGRGCSSVRSIVTVHSMVCAAIARWGTAAQQRRWLPNLAAGRALGAFALTEAGAGSDINAIETRAEAFADIHILNGTKQWITAGQIADLFLTFAKVDGRATAFLVERTTPGVEVRPTRGMLGLRGSMIAELTLDDCRVEAGALLGRIGFGLTAVGATALDVGRYSVAWGCVGIAQACLEAAMDHASRRRQFAVPIGNHQLIRRKITNMTADVSAARLLCIEAGRLKQAGSPDSVISTCMAKYVASRTCTRAARSAVQIHGAQGCGPDAPVGRYFRDAQVMEIIEGSTQLQQLLIADHALRAHASRSQSIEASK